MLCATNHRKFHQGADKKSKRKSGAGVEKHSLVYDFRFYAFVLAALALGRHFK